MTEKKMAIALVYFCQEQKKSENFLLNVFWLTLYNKHSTGNGCYYVIFRRISDGIVSEQRTSFGKEGSSVFRVPKPQCRRFVC